MNTDQAILMLLSELRQTIEVRNDQVRARDVKIQQLEREKAELQRTLDSQNEDVD